MTSKVNSLRFDLDAAGISALADEIINKNKTGIYISCIVFLIR